MYENTTRSFFGAFDENQDVVGAIAGHIKPWRTAHRCTGGVLFVTIPHQKQGIAKMLIKKLMTEAIEKYNATSFEAVTFAGNEFPLTWYEKIGIVADEDAVLIKGKCADIQSKLSHK